MSRNYNYCAFYVAEPFNPGALGAHATKDFCYYNLLRSWRGGDPTFPFLDAHATTYSVRDGSDWESTLKPRLRERIRASKNIVLFLSTSTSNSRALREEVDYGISDQGLPVIVVYPEFDSKESLCPNGSLSPRVKELWSNVPIFRDSMLKVPTLHVPLKRDLISKALFDKDLMLPTKTTAGVYKFS